MASWRGFTVENLHVQMWRETTPGGAWTGPVTLGNPGPITPAVTVVCCNDGRLQLFALRSPIDETVPQDVITSVQAIGSMAFGTWTSLGNPNSGNCGLGNCRWTGPSYRLRSMAGDACSLSSRAPKVVYTGSISQITCGPLGQR